jgi:hypothetical protein
MSARQDVDVAEWVLSRPETAATLVAGSLVLGAAGFAVARWRRWPATPAVLAGCGLALALAVTLARAGGSFTLITADPVGRCVGNGFSLAGSRERLNLLMLAPFAFFATVACRRPFAVFVVSGVFSGGVELVQAATGIGVCEEQDLYNNTVGAMAAVLSAVLVAALKRSQAFQRRGSCHPADLAQPYRACQGGRRPPMPDTSTAGAPLDACGCPCGGRRDDTKPGPTTRPQADRQTRSSC